MPETHFELVTVFVTEKLVGIKDKQNSWKSSIDPFFHRKTVVKFVINYSQPVVLIQTAKGLLLTCNV